MRILLVNKFLYETGGAETYTIKLGEYFESIGHEVQFFGMQEERNKVGNKWNILTKNINFHRKSLGTLLYPFKIIYSVEARRKMRHLIKLFRPDIVHLNNFNFQLTPSIIYEAKKHNIPVVLTAHDYQFICPDHYLYQHHNAVICEKCITSGFVNCIKNNCIHASKLRSILGAIESALYHGLKTYSLIDKVICPSEFIEKKLCLKTVFQGKTVAIHNFIQKTDKSTAVKKGDYVLYFGRFSGEKGIGTLINVCRRLPEIPFIFAGGGPIAHVVNNAVQDNKNIKNAGFLKGDDLKKMISGARFSVCPSEWYENCPFSVMESQMYGTPVIGANIGGIPELIKEGETGFLFQAGNADDLSDKITTLWHDSSLLKEMTDNCYDVEFDTIDIYGEKILDLYNQLLRDKTSQPGNNI